VEAGKGERRLQGLLWDGAGRSFGFRGACRAGPGFGAWVFKI